MAATTITLDSALRDRLYAEAACEGVPVGRIIESLLDDRDRTRRFDGLRAAVAAMSAEQRTSWSGEAAAWSAADSDGLSVAW